MTLLSWDVGLGSVLNAKQVTSISPTTPNLVYGTPVSFSVDALDNATANLSLNNQAANTVFAGPASGAAAAPTFRQLASLDVTTALGYTDIARTGVSNTFTLGQVIQSGAVSNKGYQFRIYDGVSADVGPNIQDGHSGLDGVSKKAYLSFAELSVDGEGCADVLVVDVEEKSAVATWFDGIHVLDELFQEISSS